MFYFAPMEHESTSFYRSGGVLPYLNCSEYEIINGCYVSDWNWATFINIDIAFFQRPCTQEHVFQITLAKDAGVKVIIDYDDNLFEVTQDNPTYFFYNDNRVNVLKALRLADEVWVATESIKETLKKFNQNIQVIPNAHNDKLFKDKKDFNPNTKYALWRGGMTHEGDVYANAEPILKMIKENPDWTFNWFGHAFIYLEQRCANNYIRTSHATTLQYFKAIADYNPNILFFPLIDNKFNQGKSNIAWIEGVHSGAAVFSNIKLAEYKMPGVLDFSDVTDKMNDYEVLKKANEESWAFIQDNLLLSKVNQLRHKSILSHL